jgi:hypothetical protein
MAGAPPLGRSADSIVAQLGGPPKNLSLSIDAPSGLDARVFVTFGDDATAKKFDDRLRAGLVQLEQQPMIGAYFKAVEHAQSGTDVTIRLSLNEGEFEQLVGMLTMALARR